MTQVRDIYAAFNQLMTRIRVEAGDPATDPAGNARPAAMLRFQDADLLDILNDILAEMQTELDINNDEQSIASVDITYTEDANSDGCELPLTLISQPIVRVVDRTTSTIPREVTKVSYKEIDDWESPLAIQANNNWPRMAWCLRAAQAPTLNSQKIVIRPTPPAAAVFRLYYIASPFLYFADSGGLPTDAVPFAARWRHMISVRCACALLSRTGDAPDQLLKLADTLWEQFTMFANRQRAGEHVISVRDGDY